MLEHGFHHVTHVLDGRVTMLEQGLHHVTHVLDVKVTMYDMGSIMLLMF